MWKKITGSIPSDKNVRYECYSTQEDKISIVQKFNPSAFDNKINKITISGENGNENSQYSFNLLKFSVGTLEIKGNFREVVIANANISELIIGGKASVSSNGEYNSLVLLNSVIDNATLYNLGNVIISGCSANKMSISANAIAAEEYNVPRPYGICGTLKYSGAMTLNGNSKGKSGTLKLDSRCSNESSEESLMSWSFTADNIILDILNWVIFSLGSPT